MDDIYYVLIIVIVIVAALIPLLLLLKKPKKKIKVDVTDYVNNLIDLLGGINNIKETSLEVNRLKVLLDNPNLLKKDLIKEQNLKAFLTGNEIKILLKDNIKDINQQIINLKK